MAHPAWKHPGTLNGRISPHSAAYDPLQDLYPYEAYGAGGSAVHLFCLGEDAVLPVVHAYMDDMAISVQQQFDIGAAQRLLKFCWDVHQPEGMPSPRTILTAGVADFTLMDLVDPGDGCSGIRVVSPSSPFTRADRGKILRVSGATDAGNNDDFMIDAIPSDQGVHTPIGVGDRALIYSAGLTTRMNDPAVTVKVLGLSWVTSAYVDAGFGWQERITYTEQVGHRHYRSYMALHLSKFTGTLTARFEAKLVAYA